MKHYRDSNNKVARVRVTLDMLPKGVQRAGRDKQLDVLKKILKRACNLYGIPHELKERQFYIKPGEKKRKAERLKKAVARGEIQDRQQKELEYEPKYFDEYNY